MAQNPAFVWTVAHTSSLHRVVWHQAQRTTGRYLQARRDETIRRWGEALYRRFRLYLWGSVFVYINLGVGVYRVVLEGPGDVKTN